MCLLERGTSPLSFVKKSQRVRFVAGFEDWDDDAVLAPEVLVSLEGDSLEG